MGTVLDLLCPRYNGPLTPTVPRAFRLWEPLTLLFCACFRDCLLCFQGQIECYYDTDSNVIYLHYTCVHDTARLVSVSQNIKELNHKVISGTEIH